MKKAIVTLTALLIFSALFSQLEPVTQVRYNTYNKSVDCYNEAQTALPEGCAEQIKPTVIQTWTSCLVFLSSLGLIGIGLVELGKSLRKAK